jgi:hypothetical protein
MTHFVTDETILQIALLGLPHILWRGEPLLIGVMLLGLIISLIVYEVHKPRLGFED